MNRLTSWAKTVLVGYRRHLTDQQLSGRACVLCGHRFYASEYRKSFGWIGLPGRHRAYACATECLITTVASTQALFRDAIPARQSIRFWHLGFDDIDLVAGPDGNDTVDEAQLAALDAQSRATVTIQHRHGALTTLPLPAQHATWLQGQAETLGFTAHTTPAERSA